jgi:hypothetical protein
VIRRAGGVWAQELYEKLEFLPKRPLPHNFDHLENIISVREMSFYNGALKITVARYIPKSIKKENGEPIYFAQILASRESLQKEPPLENRRYVFVMSASEIAIYLPSGDYIDDYKQNTEPFFAQAFSDFKPYEYTPTIKIDDKDAPKVNEFATKDVQQLQQLERNKYLAKLESDARYQADVEAEAHDRARSALSKCSGGVCSNNIYFLRHSPATMTQRRWGIDTESARLVLPFGQQNGLMSSSFTQIEPDPAFPDSVKSVKEALGAIFKIN